MVIIAVWALVGLFWLGVAVNTYINKSDTRKAWRTRIGEKVAFKLFDAVEWVWTKTKVLRRRSLKRSDAIDPQEIELWLLSKGVRSVVTSRSDGGCDVSVHEDDKEKLNAVFAELFLPFGVSFRLAWLSEHQWRYVEKKCALARSA